MLVSTLKVLKKEQTTPDQTCIQANMLAAFLYQSKASRQFAQPSLLRLGEKKAKTKTTI